MLDIAFLFDVLLFTILSIAWFFLTALCRRPETNRLMPLRTSKEDHRKNKSNFIVIDNQLLKAQSYPISNDIRFGENQYNNFGKYREFELYRLKMDDADTSGVSIDDDTNLQLTLELAPNGFIINSNVYLTHEQWHTIYPVSEDLRCCAVCEVYCVVTDHVGNSNHIANMLRYKPLHKYDLTITRKIKTNYHCGVCNTLFDESLKNEHFSGKTHEDKLLFAINRVSDIMYDFNIHYNNNNEKKDSYYFNTKHNNKEDAYMLEAIDEEDDDDEFNNNDDDWYPLNYNDNEDYSDEEYYDEPVQNLEFSYATMAKKPKTDDLPDVLEVDLGNKKVTVKFNSWNMLIRPMPNRFYCMACKELDHIRGRAAHCTSEGHLARLDACTVVDKYEKYFVRQVDDKCYHCGHCNNLQLINVMEDHIRSVHTHPTTVHHTILDSPAKKISSVKPTGQTTNAPEANSGKTNNEIARNGIETKTNQAENGIAVARNIIIDPASVLEGLKAANSNFEDIVISTYGSNLRISKLAFNIICQAANVYYCGLCELSIERGVLRCHLMDARHLQLLQRSPFIQAFNVHLFRQIRDALHCGLCNELIQIMPEFIIKHKYLEKHIVSLHRAMGYFQIENTAQTNVTKNNATANPKPVAEIPKIAIPSGVPNNVPNKTNTNMTPDTTKKETPITNKNVALSNIPAPNVNTKIVAVNKNISFATVNCNKNEPVANTNKINCVVAAKHVPVNVKNVPVNAKNGTENVNNAPVTAKNGAENIKNGQANAKNVPENVKNGPVTPKKVPENIKNGPVTPKKVPEHTKIGFANTEKPNEVKIEDTLIKNEKFITVKNGVKEELEDDLDDSYIEDFDLEEYVYVKLGNSYIKITNTSYNTLVDIGDGSKYCFVCSCVVWELSKHVESRGHTENMEKVKFVDKYNEDLLRQFYLMYHCSICNVVITRKQLSHHLSWPTHALQTENTKITSKKRKNEIKTGTKQITVSTQKENIYLNEKETDIKIFLHVTIDKEKVIERLNKIVIFNDNVLKVPFDFWHSLSEVANGYTCKVCQSDFEDDEFVVHVASEWHKGNLEKFEKQYSPALIRKISDATLNCVMCNTEVANKKHIVTEHIQGKKHIKNYETMVKESSANSYADCDQDVVML